MNQLSIRQVAAALGMSEKRTVEFMQQLHEKHGGLLFQSGPGAKFWVEPAALRRILPDRFKRAVDSAEVLDIHERISRTERAIAQVQEELAAMNRRLSRETKRLHSR